MYEDHTVKQVVYNYLNTVKDEMGCTYEQLIQDTLWVLHDLMDNAAWERDNVPVWETWKDEQKEYNT